MDLWLNPRKRPGQSPMQAESKMGGGAGVGIFIMKYGSASGIAVHCGRATPPALMARVLFLNNKRNNYLCYSLNQFRHSWNPLV